MSTRRQFISTTGLALTGLALSASSGFPLIGKKPKVLILGGGFAGLAAGLRLYDRGIDFQILEAGSVVGGRVKSHVIDPAEKLVIELGAEWIGEDHHYLKELCGRFKIEYKNNQFDSQVIYGGKHYKTVSEISSPSWDSKFEELLKAYKELPEKTKEKLGKRLDHIDWWRYLEENGCSGVDLDLRELMDSTDFGESIRFVSAYAALEEYTRTSDNSKNEMDYKMVGGNQQLAYKIYDLFPEKILCKKEVMRIEHGNNVVVHCKDGSSYTGDQLICTIPTFAISKVTWSPALPESMTNAIQELQYARINKHAVLFENRFWKDESFDMITDMPGHYFYHATKNQASTKGALISYSIGDKAAIFANQSKEANAELVCQSLRPAFPDVKSLIREQVNFYWGANKFSQGAYAMYGKGQWNRLWPELSRDLSRIHFAGEHLSENWQGFMEGALETGRDAADRV